MRRNKCHECYGEPRCSLPTLYVLLYFPFASSYFTNQLNGFNIGKVYHAITKTLMST